MADTLKDVLDYAIEEASVIGTQQGLLQGAEQERIVLIQAMLAHGCDWTFIQKITQASQEEYRILLQKHSASMAAALGLDPSKIINCRPND